MRDTFDPTARWTRQLTSLRSRVQRRDEMEGCVELIEAALAVCDGLLRDLAGEHLECERLRVAVRAETATWEHLFEVMPAACILTDEAGLIRNANQAAVAILNTGVRRLKDHPLIVFAEDRAAFSVLLQRLARGGEHVHATIALRPRERRLTPVDVTAVPLSGDHTGDCLWFLSPNTDSQKLSRAEVLAAQTGAAPEG